MQSLRDKMIQAGLIKAGSAPAEPRDAPRRDAHAGRRGQPRREERAEPRIPKLPPLPGSKEAHRLQARKQLELDRTLREKVLAAQVPQEPGATTFHFVTRKNRLRRLELSEAQAAQLQAGVLAVVERPDPDKIEHALVTAAVAEELLALSARAVRFLNRPGAEVGFLSEEEIHRRSAEADGDPEAEANDGDGAEAAAAVAGPETATTATAGPAEASTFITVKRAPRP
jgi:uncharacterized protein YaiL (DUF2058 family)